MSTKLMEFFLVQLLVHINNQKTDIINTPTMNPTIPSNPIGHRTKTLIPHGRESALYIQLMRYTWICIQSWIFPFKVCPTLCWGAL